MHRRDLEQAYRRRPDIPDIWAARIARLENDRKNAWSALEHTTSSHVADSNALAQRIERLDRSISLLDRLLIHIDDIRGGTHHADSLPYRPG